MPAMGVVVFARLPPLLFSPNPNTQSPVPPEAPSKAGNVLLSPTSSVTTKAALKWLNKVHGHMEKNPRQPCLFHPLFTKHDDTESSRPFSQHSTGEEAVKASQKQPVGNLQNGPPFDDHQRRRKSRKYSSKVKERSPHAHAKRKKIDTIKVSSRADGDESLTEQETGGNHVPERRIPEPRTQWWPHATLASGAAAAMGIESSSAQAAVGHGGNGPPGSGGGGGGGGGGDNGGGFGEGSSGESFFGDIIYGPRRKRYEGKLPRSSVLRSTTPGRPSAEASDEAQVSTMRVRTLASLSSAAGDLMEGEAPIRRGGGMMSRGSEEADHIPKHLQSLGSYSTAKMAFDGTRESSRESLMRKYDPSEPFFAADASIPAHDHPAPSAFRPPPAESPPAGVNSLGEGSRRREAFRGGRNTKFDAMPSPSGKLQQPYNNYLSGNDFNKDPRGSYYSHATSRGTHHQVPPGFSSIREKITEIPGFVQEGGVRSKDHRHEFLQHAIGFSGWVGGLVHSVVGKVTGVLDSVTRNRNVGDDGKKTLVAEVAARTMQIISDQVNETGLAKSSETGALRRLQRETFSDLLKVRERLDKLEHHTGVGRGKKPGDALAGVKTTLKGEVNSGGAFVLIEDLTSNLSRFSLQHAGMLTGLDVRFTFETPMRENDLLTTQCGVGHISGESDNSILGGPISLQKINYVAQVNETLSLSVAPLGAKASDMADTVNHLQGQALTTFAGAGPALYQHCIGSAIGASLRSNSMLLSVSHFLSGWGNKAADATSGPLCLSTLAQFMVQPCEHMVLSMAAVNNLWPSPPLPSSIGLHWSEMGPLVLCKTITRPTQPTGTFTFRDLPSSSSTSFLSQVRVPERDSWSPDVESRGLLGSSGTSMQSVAFSGEVDLGGHVSLGGWAQVERPDWLEELEKKDFQWNVSLAKSTGQHVNWGLSIGRRKREDWGEDGSSSPTAGPLEPSSQLQMEGFVKLKVGRGFSVQPGLVYIIDKYTQTPAFMVRSSWTL